ncbi:MAG: tetratricopeptide repeat protein [Methylococcales bacterium]|nr:tetratricopeptide repeat protein [Methylococcales bacterium]
MNKHESVLFTNGKLAIFAGIALTALVLAFPGKQLLSTLDGKPADIASLAYTRAAFNRQPNNAELRLRLVEKLYEINQIKEAVALLQPLTLVDAPAIDVLTLHIKLTFRQYFEAKSHREKRVLKRVLTNNIQRVSAQLVDISMLDELAELSQQLGEPLIAAHIYQRIIEMQDASPDEHIDHSMTLLYWMGISNAYAEPALKSKPKQYYIEKQLQALLAANKGDDALKWAEYYVKQQPKNTAILQMGIEIAQAQNDAIRARDWGRLLVTTQSVVVLPKADIPPCKEEAQVDKRVWECQSQSSDSPKISLPSSAFINFVKQVGGNNAPLQQQLQKELAANQLDDSLLWIEQQLLINPTSEDTLRMACLLAKRQGNKRLSREWSERLLRLKPKDVELLQQQIDAELAVSDLKKALGYAQQWLSIVPNSTVARSKVADIAMWAGDPEVTLAQLFWLYLHTQQPEALDKTIDLATKLFNHDLIADIYTQISATRQLTEEEAARWFSALQSSGREDAGAGLLQQYVSHWPGHQTVWQLLAKTQSLLGRVNDALETTAQIEQRFHARTDVALTQVDYLMKMGKIQEAWQVLLKTSAGVPSDDLKFWDKFVATAFLVGAEKEMLWAYQKNPDVGRNKPMLNFYLLAMLRQNEDTPQYNKFAVQIFDKTKELSTLLDLISFNMQHNKWDEARTLLASLSVKEARVGASSQYWLAKAEIDGHFGDKKMAQSDIKTALQLDPESASIRSLLLWHLVAENNKTELAQFLQESNGRAQAQPALWEAMAAGYRAVGESQAAMQWYAKALKQWPSRQPLIMGYADVLQEANQPTKARQLWRYILARFKPSAANTADGRPKEDASAFERRYAELVRLYLGTNAAEKWRQWLAQHQGSHNTDFSEFRIAWFLAQQRPEQAKALLVNAEHDGVALPPWQRLAVAMTDNDTVTTNDILQAKGSKLSKLDEISALRALGSDEEALKKTTALLNTQQSESELEALRKQAAELATQRQNGWAVGVKTHNVSQLDIVNDTAEMAWSRGKNRFLMNYQDRFYSTSDKKLTIADTMRHEKLLGIEWHSLNNRYQTGLKVGANLRDDKNYVSVESNFSYLLQKGWNARVEAGYNVLSTEGAVFRLAGLADKLEARLSGEFSKREYFSVNAHGQRYKTRAGQGIGYGYGAGFEAGYRVFFEKPEVVVALHGSWKKSVLDDQLPNDWQGIVEPNTRMSSIINTSYNDVGIDVRLKEGEFRPFGYTDRSFRYFADAGVFYNGSSGNFGTKVQGGVGTRLFKDDEIGLSGYYSSVQGSVQSQPSTALELRYSKRFD